MIAAAWIALFAPAAAVVAIALAGNRIGRFQAGLIASGATGISFVCSLIAFVALLRESADERVHYSTLWTWLSAGELRFEAQILVEALFVFSMLLLVQSGNLLLLLAGWGLVGLSSYLLINFWHFRWTAVAAGKKAFIMNAIGDATFALALFLLIQRAGSLDFRAVFRDDIAGQSSTVAVLIALGLLGGAVAKSAQVPLHTWLPDAMEGPTPVSALIHAATMVTAGVYLIARTHVLFELAPAIEHLAGVLGAITILLAGLIALVQTDIKRVIAYSTMSQIG